MKTDDIHSQPDGMTQPQTAADDNQGPRRRKGRLRAMFTLPRVFVCAFLIWLFFFAPGFGDFGQDLAREVCMQVYAPPLLTEKEVTVYAEFIRIVQKHTECESISLDPWGRFTAVRPYEFVRDRGEPLMVWFDFGVPGGMKPGSEVTASFPPAELAALKNASVKLAEIHAFARMVRRENGYSFVDFGRIFYLMTGSSSNDINDVRHGVGDDTLVRIRGRWYASWLRPLAHFQLFHSRTLPKSLIDHSLEVPPNLDAESARLSSEVSKPTE